MQREQVLVHGVYHINSDYTIRNELKHFKLYNLIFT